MNNKDNLISFKKYISNVKEMVKELTELIDLYRDTKISEPDFEEMIKHYTKTYPTLLFEEKKDLILRRSLKNRIGVKRTTILEGVLKKTYKDIENKKIE